MSDTSLTALAVVGSLHRDSALKSVMLRVGEHLRAGGCAVDVLDLEQEPLELYNPQTTHGLPHYPKLQARVERADILILGTPDYHGSMSGVLKNFLDHFWREFAGKLFATVVASHEKGLTVTDQLRTVARQCYAWALPYGVSFVSEAEVKDGKVTNPALEQRLDMMVRDMRVYGGLLSRQRRTDLTGSEPGFLARHRK